MSLHLTNYWLYVSASGSLITVIFSFCTFTVLFRLHFVQKSANFFSSVSSLTIIRALLLYTGYRSQVAAMGGFHTNHPTCKILLYGIHFLICIPTSNPINVLKLIKWKRYAGMNRPPKACFLCHKCICIIICFSLFHHHQYHNDGHCSCALIDWHTITVKRIVLNIITVQD